MEPKPKAESPFVAHSPINILLHYVVLPSPDQAIARVALRVKLGGHSVPEEDVRRRFDRSRRNFLEAYLALADEWVLWDNTEPPHCCVAASHTNSTEEIRNMLSPHRLQETPPMEMSEMVRIGLEASRVATEKMVDHYKRMGIKVTPQMTLAPDEPHFAAAAIKGRRVEPDGH